MKKYLVTIQMKKGYMMIVNTIASNESEAVSSVEKELVRSGRDFSRLNVELCK